MEKERWVTIFQTKQEDEVSNQNFVLFFFELTYKN